MQWPSHKKTTPSEHLVEGVSCIRYDTKLFDCRNAAAAVNKGTFSLSLFQHSKAATCIKTCPKITDKRISSTWKLGCWRSKAATNFATPEVTASIQRSLQCLKLLAQQFEKISATDLWLSSLQWKNRSSSWGRLCMAHVEPHVSHQWNGRTSCCA